MFKKILTLAIAAISFSALAEEAQITGTVAPKCVINIDTPGVYGNPTPNKLSTDAADGGVAPIIRFDVVQAGYYKASISTPVDFSSAPTLTDVVNWAGTVEINQVTDPAMSAYETSVVRYNNTSEYDLTVAGTTWFKANSIATYGYNKAFPSGNYKSIVIAECIAK